VKLVRRRVPAVAALILAATLLAAACGGGGDDEPEAEPKPEKKEAPEPTAPLTGLPDPDGTAASRQAMFVKIDNADFEGTRPQSGLELADVVYEEVVEYNITRFNAVFNSQIPEPVGPIRSVRAMDSDIVFPLGGTFAFSGGTEANVELIRQAPVTIVDENNAGDAFYRYDQKDAPHNLYGHGQALFDFGGEPIPPPSLFKYVGEGKSFTGDEPIGVFTVGFAQGYAPTYTWDDASGTWTRDIEGAPFVMENGTQIAPTNVIVQFIQYGASGGEGTIVGEGDAWVFSDGQVARGRWVRPVREQVTQYVDAAGKEISLTPGTTWVEFLPIGAPVALQPPATPAG
jgi:Protein of unknown function (DUF3048) N-terminal domain/Protein of unknown function (DUF3048) C-terminal domain